MPDENGDKDEPLYEVYHWYKTKVARVAIFLLIIVEVVLIYSFTENLFQRTSNWTPFLTASVVAMSLLVSVGAIVFTNSEKWMYDSKKDILAFYDTFVKGKILDPSAHSWAVKRLERSEGGRASLHILSRVKDWADYYAKIFKAMNEMASDQEKTFAAIFLLWGAGIGSALLLILAPIQAAFFDAILFPSFMMAFTLEALAFYLLVYNFLLVDVYSGFENRETWLALDLPAEREGLEGPKR